jgi:hypothetical protein
MTLPLRIAQDAQFCFTSVNDYGRLIRLLQDFRFGTMAAVSQEQGFLKG